MKRAMLILSVWFVGCMSGVATAETSGNVYSNRYVGLSFPVPTSWYVATDSETMLGMQDGARVMGLDNPATSATIAQMQGKVLLMVSERPFDSTVQAANRNTVIVAISVRDIKSEIGSGADYLRHVARGLRESQPSATVSDITMQTLGGEQFHRLTVALPMQGITAHMAQLARVHNDYLVVLNITADSESGLAGLIQLADSLRLSPVSSTVDKSVEGEAFRKQASLQLPKSSGNPFLKNAGLIVMVVGVLIFLQGLFRKKRP